MAVIISHVWCEQVRPLDYLSKCRALLPAEVPESRVARMAVKPKLKRNEVSSRPSAYSGVMGQRT